MLGALGTKALWHIHIRFLTQCCVDARLSPPGLFSPLETLVIMPMHASYVNTTY